MARRRLVPVASVALVTMLSGAFLGSTAVPAAGAAPKAVPAVHVVLNGSAVTMKPQAVVIDGVPYVSAPALAGLLNLPATWNPRTDTLVLGTAPSTAHSFVFQGMRYAVTGLQARTDPAAVATSGTSGLYWLVSYALTNVSNTAIDVATTQPQVMLLGPKGTEYEPDSALSGPTAGTLNPGITFTSYAVFNVPAGATPGPYALGFDAYRSTAKGFLPAALGAGLPAANSVTHVTDIGATYSVSNLWNSEVQQVLLRSVVRTDAVVPDLTAASFNPTTSFWVVDFSINNPGADAITLSPSAFSLQFQSGASLSPYPVSNLPGYVPANSLFTVGSGSSSSTQASSSPGSVTVAPGQVWNGALLFEVPDTVTTTQPAFAITVSGQQRIMSLAPCPDGACPPVQE